MSEKKDKMYGFRFFKAILGMLFKVYYNPRIIGKENIPAEGAILLVGNHIHIMDQCLPILATKRPVHYMAKKEYFDNKKVAWFFRLGGCIPVDRSKKDERASSAALKVLHDGYALGLFPEGTRNALKEEKIQELFERCKPEDDTYDNFKQKTKKQKTSYVNYLEELRDMKKITEEDFQKNIYRVNDYLVELVDLKVISKKEYEDRVLLPFKFGAVSMAKKTDSYLVPFGISGDYKFRSKNLVVRIGKPFKVQGDLETANNKLRDSVKKLMQEDVKK